MKKIINAPERFIPEMLEGIYAAHPDELMCVGGDLHCLVSKRKHAGKVGIATGGGSGHLPLFLGYVGEGMLDGCSIGDVFQSPSAEQMLAVTKEIDQGAGVLYIYGNYNGDIFNFDMAAEMADMEEDIRVESVVAGEDVASAGPSAEGEPNKRRGVAGIFFVYKCAGAAAAAGLDLDEVKRVAERHAPTCAPWVWRSPPARCRAWDIPALKSGTTRWKSAWAFMASRAFAAASCVLPTRSWTRCSRPFSATCPSRKATRWPCSSTAWARPRWRSST